MVDVFLKLIIEIDFKCFYMGKKYDNYLRFLLNLCLINVMNEFENCLKLYYECYVLFN